MTKKQSRRHSKPKAREADRVFRAADAAWDRGELRRAFALFSQAAWLGDVGAQVNLGYFYDEGLGVAKDELQALRWYRKAYAQGDPSAANNIATIYRDRGETQRMLWWFRRSADMGATEVLLELGKRYELGQDVPRNPAKAVDYYRRVIDHEHSTEDEIVEAEACVTRLRNTRHVK